MRLKVTLQRPGGSPPQDLMCTIDATVRVSDLALALKKRDPQWRDTGIPSHGQVTLRLDSVQPARTLRPSATIAEAGLRSGDVVSLETASTGAFTAEQDAKETAAIMTIVSGLGAGREFPLRPGGNQLGRDRGNDIRLEDPQISKRHARINVTDSIEIIDLGSSNGVVVGGSAVPRAIVAPLDEIQLGDTVVRIAKRAGQSIIVESGAAEPFVRPPRLDPIYPGATFKTPAPPEPIKPQRIGIAALLVPLLFGGVMFAVTKSALSVLFVLLSPVMLLGGYFEQKVGGKRAFRALAAQYQVELDHIVGALQTEGVKEVQGRRAERPATAEIIEAIRTRGPLLWTRRPDRPGFLSLRIGLGRDLSRRVVELPQRNAAPAMLWDELERVATEASTIDGVPLTADLLTIGTLGVAGPRAAMLSAARSLLVQLIGLHSPAEVVLCAFTSPTSAKSWSWLPWLPHTSSEHSPIIGGQLATGVGPGSRLLAELEDLLASRLSAQGAFTGGPAIVVLVEDDCGLERARLVEMAEHGPAGGINLLWLATDQRELPASCQVFVNATGSAGTNSIGHTLSGVSTSPVELENADEATCIALARSLARVVDAGARVDDASDLPRSVSLLALDGDPTEPTAENIIDTWRTSGTLHTPETNNIRRSKDAGLRARVGMGAGQSFTIDLRTQGPHALVGGTTGSGKSEFLQTWVLGMAAEHSPSRVTFLFVDYKGGSAFGECVRLPHAVGMVTDLSPHLVQRVLLSLSAELRYRERLLHKKKAKDLISLEREGDPEAPPALVLICDEFAALVKEVPEFVDGVVNIAQRGRSLGLHLVLATQRPAGVIKDNLRANTNLRVALRMADEDDSRDVLGTPAAAAFDPSLPGRALAKTGPGRLTAFQAGYAGGWTSDEPPPPIITVQELGLGIGATWEPPAEAAAPEPTGPNDLARTVDAIRAAAEQAGVPTPRRPWLDDLAPIYDLRRSKQSRTDTELIFGVLDDPDNQEQRTVAFYPDVDGNMAIFGTGGSGKSTALRALAIAAGLTARGGPCQVYALDFAGRGLQMLESLPHVGAVIAGDDDERLSRLIRMLRATIDERAIRYSAARAGTISEYRTQAAAPNEPRILILVDAVGAFRLAYETGERLRMYEMFNAIAAEGRQVGVHVIMTADRLGSVSTQLASLVQRRLVLRMATDDDYIMLGAPKGVISAASPPGRGVIDTFEVQVLILGNSGNTAEQAELVAALADGTATLAARALPASIGRLEEHVSLADLPVLAGTLPAVGVADDTLAAAGIVTEDVLLVSGPPQSGRSSVLATLVLASRRAGCGRLILLSPKRAPVLSSVPWDECHIGEDDIGTACKALVEELKAPAAGPRPLIVIESVNELANGAADMPLQDLLKAAKTAGCFVMAEGETSQVTAYGPVLQMVRAARHGIALQPDQGDGDSLFRVSFPRLARSQFPPGRGLYVRAGRIRRIQFATPEV